VPRLLPLTRDAAGPRPRDRARHRAPAGRRSRALSAALVAAALLGAAPEAAAQERAVPGSRAEISLSFAPVVREAAPAVVNIYTRRVVRERVSPLLDDPFFRRFFGGDAFRGVPRERVQNSLGSGVIVDPAGLIVTNEHVVRGADEITVVLSDRREYDARLVSADPSTDLAVLRIEAGGRLPALETAPSDGLEVGDLVLAIGNPFGVGQTVTMGIVSALARTGAGITDFNFFIQTDAAINPGNSGGALVDVRGRLVGVNTAIFSRSGGSIGIGFAIPSEMVRVVVDAARGGGLPVRPWLGADGQPVDADVARALGLDRPAGVLVTRVEAGSPADRAGLARGDVVTAVDGRAVDDPDALRFRIATLRVGGRASLTALRDGRPRELTLPVEAPPEVPPRDDLRIGGRNPFAGALVANLSPALVEAERLHELGTRRGVVVLDVAAGTPAARVGLRRGDVVLRVDGREVGTVRDLAALAERPRASWRLEVRRGDRVLSTTVQG